MFYLQEAISSVPDGYAQLLEVLLPRFQPKYNIKGVTIEDQESLVNNSNYACTYFHVCYVLYNILAS